jgi:hypothetical protein
VTDDSDAARAAARASWPIRRYRLGEEPPDYTASLVAEADLDAARRARAEARRLRPMVFEPIRSLDEAPALHEGDSVEVRLTAMTELCRRAWLASGLPLTRVPRDELPGEVFRIDDARRAPR